MPAPSASPYRVRFASLDEADIAASWTDLRGSAAGTPFDDLAYVRAAADAFDLAPFLVLAFESDRPVAGVPLYVRNRLGHAEAVIPPFSPYTPLVQAGDLHPTEINTRRSPIDAILASIEGRVAAAALHLTPAVQDVRSFQWRGWSVQPLFTYHVPLEAASSPIVRWSKNNRRLFRRQGAAARFVESADAVETVLELSRESYARHGRSAPATLDRLRRLTRPLVDAGALRAFTLTPDSAPEPEAGVLILQTGATAYYWMAGSRPGSAATLLLGHLQTRLAADGVQGMDFVGANTPSIAEFKRKFGSVLTPYYRAHYVSGLLPRLIDLARTLR